MVGVQLCGCFVILVRLFGFCWYFDFCLDLM